MNPALRLVAREVCLATLVAAAATASVAWVVGAVEGFAGGATGASAAWVVLRGLPWTTAVAGLWTGLWWRRTGRALAVCAWGVSPSQLAGAAALGAAAGALVVVGLCVIWGGITPSAGQWWQAASGDWYLQLADGKWLHGSRADGVAEVSAVAGPPSGQPWPLRLGEPLAAGVLGALGNQLGLRGGLRPL